MSESLTLKPCRVDEFITTSARPTFKLQVQDVLSLTASVLTVQQKMSSVFPLEAAAPSKLL